MRKIDYIFLDLDGPILDGKLRHYNCYRDIILKDGGVPIDIDQYWNMKRAKIKRDIILHQSQYQNTYENFLQQWIDNIEKKEYLKFDELKPYISDTLSDWRDFAKSIVLVTMRNNHDNLLWQLHHFGIYNLLDNVISCSNIKQEGGKYNELKGLSFNTAIVIGDTEEDTITAEKLGIKVIAITNGLREKKHLCADYYFEEIYQIDMKQIISVI
ncbi:HAD family hydrolase [Pelosinus fermentans]|uniref:Haloacid dehalogenase domain protein hydrolase n=1 Tax=Pelosinus fermentans JBW45 TaxID=1192197 RepID=I9DDY3_9FIRM|nr:HAD hydrolase-like protein [Pelosinus fermentans]AJQ26088.1 hypothetical protein JBW_00736 [Pelosinus fermentans JBW45]